MIRITFDMESKTVTNNQRGEIQHIFQHFGWEAVGGSVYRLGGTALGGDDWWNAAIPALMLFRSYVLRNGIRVTCLTVDSISSSESVAGTVNQGFPLPSSAVQLECVQKSKYAEKFIRDWLDACEDGVRVN